MLNKTISAYPLNSILTAPVMDGVVALVLVRDGTELAVQTISSFAEAAHHPASVWVAMPKASQVSPLIQRTELFTLAVLSYQQRALAQRFASLAGVRGDGADDLGIYKSQQGFDFLHGALASTGCRVRSSSDLADAVLFLADIVESQMDSRRTTQRQLLISELWRE